MQQVAKVMEEGNRASKVDKSGCVQVGGACEQWLTCGSGNQMNDTLK